MVKRETALFLHWTVAGTMLMAWVVIHATANNEWFGRPPKPIGDGLCYESIAYSLYSGHGFRENYADLRWRELYESESDYESFLESVHRRNVPATGRPPLLPLLISGVYCAIGRGPLGFQVVRVVSALSIALAVGLSCGLTARILGSLGANKLVASLGAVVVLGLGLGQRTVRDYCTDFLTEPLALLFTQLLITIVVLMLLRLRELNRKPCNVDQFGDCIKDVRRLPLIFAGVVFGLMILTRSLFVFWLPVLSILLFMSLTGYCNRLRGVITFVLSALIVCLPWWIHNCIALQRFMPLGTQGAIALAGGFCDEAYQDGGNWNHQPELQVRERVAVEVSNREKDQVEQELMVVEECRKLVSSWISEHWSMLPSLAIKRAITHWNPYSGKALLWKVAIVLGITWSLVRSERLKWWLVGLPLLSTVVTMCLYETGGRFLVPLYGLLFTLSGLGVSGWLVSKQD